MIIHVIAMLIATFSLKKQSLDFELLFALWTMRPRMNLAVVWWHMASAIFTRNKPYLWALKDAVIQESLLNILALGFAAQFIFIQSEAMKLDAGASEAATITIAGGIELYCGNDEASPSLTLFWIPFYLIAAAGIISLLLLVTKIANHCAHRNNKQYQDVRACSEAHLSGCWKAVLIVGSLNMILTCVAQWLIWSSKQSSTLSTLAKPQEVTSNITVLTMSL